MIRINTSYLPLSKFKFVQDVGFSYLTGIEQSNSRIDPKEMDHNDCSHICKFLLKLF